MPFSVQIKARYQTGSYSYRLVLVSLLISDNKLCSYLCLFVSLLSTLGQNWLTGVSTGGGGGDYSEPVPRMLWCNTVTL